MRVIVELIAARLVGDELRYAFRRAACPKRADPAATARAELAVAFPSLWLHTVLVHPTNWRYEDGSVVLTHIALIDELPLVGLPLSLRLGRVEREQGDAVSSVAAHALRQLAFAVREDPRTLGGYFRPETFARLVTAAPDPAARVRVDAA